MNEAVKALAKKRYDEIRRTIIADSIDIVLNTIASQTKFEEKDKTFTTIKPKISPLLSDTFCFKKSTKNNIEKETPNDTPIQFSPNIYSAMEISFNELKLVDFTSVEINEGHHFFIFPLVIDNKDYIVTYAEKNKYSKRKIIKVMYNNVKVDESVITPELRKKYNFFNYINCLNISDN
ncbi:hypothetical protein LY90DRAFT_697320 [Neocallimastix californiae]|uniref:Uncharacterized protein n=1 Tax=Neocallimastix californiae TaxID=1754190 RepID=A0A1Y2FHE3_9FUNG|nr:hypothetical protein LY90DRAFT_697320 [Neocallimastix californiae]|eukprot:ORY83378.1 hypothetical protein LY90DRAFT_697320 [Neocallimastix californiae]